MPISFLFKLIIFFFCLLVFITNSYAIEFNYNNVFGRGPSKLPGHMNYPQGIGVDSVNGSVYVMDSLFHRLQKFDDSGNYIRSWTVNGGVGVAVDQNTHDVYVVSRSQEQVLKFDENGNHLFSIGQAGGGVGEFNSPKDVAVIPGSGNLLVLDSANKRVQRFDSQGNFLDLFNIHTDAIDPYGISVTPDGQYLYIAGTKSNKLFKHLIDGTFIQKHDLGEFGSGPGELRWPRNIAIAGDGSVFVADTDNERIQKFDPDFAYIAQFQGPHNLVDGPFHPRAVDVNINTGAVYVAAAYAQRVDEFDLNGNYIHSFGDLETYGPVFNNQQGIIVDKFSQTLLIADTQNHLIKRFSLQGDFVEHYGAPGMVDRTLKYMDFSMEIQADADGGFWGIQQGLVYWDFPDSSAGFIRKYDDSGNFLFGFTRYGFRSGMHGLAVDNTNNLVFVADTNNHLLFKFDFSGNELMNFGGYGTEAGKFIKPAGIAVDEQTQRLYVIDSVNNRVQLFDYDGNFLQEWGTGGTGPGEFAFSSYSQCTVDEYGFVYVVDSGNGRVQIFDKVGQFITAIGEYGYGRPFKFAYPASAAVYKHVLYVSDTGGKEVEIFDIAYPDDDGDLMADVWEIKYFGNLSRDGGLDFDQDGLTDFEESSIHTDPTNIDSDGDSIPDGWEVANNLNPLIDDADNDNDRDGYTNLYEYEHSSDPNDPTSFPSVGDYTIFIDSNWTGIKSGTINEPYANLSDINWSSSNSAAFTGSRAIINLKAGSEWNEALAANNNGMAGNPIVIQKYSVGADPVINGAGSNHAVDFRAMQYITISDVNAKGGNSSNWRCNGCDYVTMSNITSTDGLQGILIQNDAANVVIDGFTSAGGLSTSIVLDAGLQTSSDITFNNIFVDQGILVKNSTSASFNSIRYTGTPFNAFTVHTNFDGSLIVNDMEFDAAGIGDRGLFVTGAIEGIIVFTNIMITNTDEQGIYLLNTGRLGEGSKFENIVLQNCDKGFIINNSTNFAISNITIEGTKQGPDIFLDGI